MKKKLLLLTGQGFLGLNFIKNFKKKFFITIAGTFSNKLIKYKISKEVKIINKNIFKIKKFNGNRSYVIITTLNNTETNFYNKFKVLIKNLKITNPKKVILISTAVIKNKKQVKLNSDLYKYIKNAELAEKICSENFNNLIILRVANIFGPLKNKPSFIEKIIISSTHKSNFIYYKSNLIRSYIYIDEFCKIIKKILYTKMKQNLYYISNKNFILSTNQILKIFSKLKYKFNIDYNKKSPEVLKYIVNSSVFKNEVKFKFENNFVKRLKYTKIFYENYYHKKKVFFL
jgi:nucleoside-diphosphate-sugar epimerase